MPSAGYNSTVKITGAPVAMAAEATTELVADTVFQITSAAKRIIDPDAALTVLVNAVPVSSGFTVDYLFGKVTFSPALGAADVVTLTGNYLPTSDLLEAKEASISMTRDLADSTVFKADPNRTRTALLKDASGSISVLRACLDAVVGTTLFDLLGNGTRKVLEIVPGSGVQTFRAWVRFDSEEVKAAIEDLVSASIGWKAVTSENGKASFGLAAP